MGSELLLIVSSWRNCIYPLLASALFHSLDIPAGRPAYLRPVGEEPSVGKLTVRFDKCKRVAQFLSQARSTVILHAFGTLIMVVTAFIVTISAFGNKVSARNCCLDADHFRAAKTQTTMLMPTKEMTTRMA